MFFQTILFYVFAAVLLGSAIFIITARNAVHAVLCMVLCFFTSAALWLLLEAEFLAIVLVLVYAGAVMVLFLFVVMMLDVNTDALREGFWRHFPVAAMVGVIIVLEMAVVLIRGFDVRQAPAPDAVAVQLGNTKALGIEMYTAYLYPLQIAAVILLVAIVAAIALTLRRRKDTKYQSPAQQVRVRPAERVRLVSMPAEKDR